MLTQAIGSANVDDLLHMLAHAAKAERSMISLFSDGSAFLSTLLKSQYHPSSRLLCAGHVTPEIEMAADMAEVDLTEIIPTSPFSGNSSLVLEQIKHPFDMIYLANPNRVTGANHSLADIEKLVQAVPNGLVIVDEYFYDYFGITASGLVNVYRNVVVLRSFTASFGIYTAECGYAIGSSDLIKEVSEGRPETISSTVRKTIFAALNSFDLIENRLEAVREESMRISQELVKVGLQSRITATDFLLLRVASPKDVGNFLAGYKVSVENLDGYPQMKGYLRYRIQSPLSNDNMIKAFKQMPRQYFSMKSTDHRSTTLIRKDEPEAVGKEKNGIEELLTGTVKERARSLEVTKS